MHRARLRPVPAPCPRPRRAACAPPQGSCHLVVESVIGEARKAEQLGPLGPQRDHFGNDGAVVGRPPFSPRLSQAWCAFCAGPGGRRTAKTSPPRSDSVMAYLPFAALLGGGRAAASTIRQAGEVAFLQRERTASRRPARSGRRPCPGRQPLVDRGQPLLSGQARRRRGRIGCGSAREPAPARL